MAKVQHYHTRLEHGEYYHIYNRAVGGQQLFRSDENCRFFMQQYAKFVYPVAETFAYALLGNHFHFLVRIREEPLPEPALSNFQSLTKLQPTKPQPTKLETMTPSGQFKRLFQSYSLAFNKLYGRTGTLFETPFKRAHVDSQDYLVQLVYYIHANPQAHGLTQDFRNWTWSSYQAIVTQGNSRIGRDEVLSWFGGMDNFIAAHSAYKDMVLDSDLLLE
jgi:putative transposase